MERTTWTGRELNDVLDRTSPVVRVVQLEQSETVEQRPSNAPLELDEIEPYVREVLDGLDPALIPERSARYRWSKRCLLYTSRCV